MLQLFEVGKATREGTRSYILDPNTEAVALKCLIEWVNFIDGAVTLIWYFPRTIILADKGRRYQLFEKIKGVIGRVVTGN